MNNEELVAELVRRITALGAADEQTVWERVSKEYLSLTGAPLDRAAPYHIAIAAAVLGSTPVRQILTKVEM